MRMNRTHLACLAGLFGFFVLGAARAQNPSDIGLSELEKEEYKQRSLIKDLLRGTVTANAGDKTHTDAIDFLARFDLYRLANPLYHNPGTTPMDQRRTIHRLYEEFDQDVRNIVSGKEKTKDMARLFGLKVIEHARKVLNDPKANPLVQVNAARFLARSADLGQPELADALAEILQEPQSNDGVKYWALNGLRRLFAQPVMPPVLSNGRAAKVLPPIMALINRKMAITQATPREEIEGFRSLRREAIRALAQSRVPALSPREQPALLLARVMAREDFTPPVRMDERAEAALGLARMRGVEKDKEKDYQPDYAAQQIALFLDEFANWYQTKNKEEEHRPVRVLAAQLLEALDQLATDSKDPYIAGLVNNPKGGMKKLLETIEKGGNADPSELVTLAAANPSSGQLFKSSPDSKVKEPNRKAE
jgi:hypothetical protein